MSAGFYNEEEQLSNFGSTIAVSVFLHVVFIAFIFLLANDRSAIKITTSIYTVDLLAPGKTAVSPEVRANSEALKKERSQAEVVSKPVKQAQDKDISRPVVKEKAIALKKEKEHSLDEAIKKIQKWVEKREAEETISKVIQGMENRQVEKRIGEIKEKVAHRQIIRPSKKDTGLMQNRDINNGVGDIGANLPIKKGTGLMQNGGHIKKIEEIEEKYGNLLWEIISPKWNYTGDIKEGEFVVITVRIDKTGHLIKSYVEQPSANPILLQSAIRAIEKAAPSFPSFPPELEKDSLEIGVCFPECGN
ncbi:MAG: cell envelope integrity protein TolA [Deltaproteobacteria bacterium]